MPDNQVFTNPSNSHCSVSQPVQNLSQFSFRIKSFSAFSVDRLLLLSVRMSPAVLKTRSLGMVLVGRPIKRQRQPLAGRVIQVENIDRFLFAYFCETSSVNTACGNSVSCIKGIKRGHNWRAAGERASGEPDRGLQLVSEHTAGGRLYKSTGFIGRFSRVIQTVNCAVTSDSVQNVVL